MRLAEGGATALSEPRGMYEDIDVLIVGAGPVGLMLAAELLRHGASCRIVDRLPEPSPFCRALGVQSRTLEIFDQLALADRALEQGVRMLAANTWKDGQLIQRMELDWQALPDIPFPMFLSLEQNLTEGLLLEHLGRMGGRVEREVTLTDIAQDGVGVLATLSSKDGSRQLRSRYAVGCDGAHSVVRKKMGISYEGEPYPDTYMLADVDVEGPLRAEESHRFIRGDEVMMAVPMRGARRFRLSTREANPPTPSEGTPEHGLLMGEATPPTVEEMQAAADRIAGIGMRITRCRWTSRYRISRRLAGMYRKDRVFLAGDACHIHPPTGGQGMNMGIQDAHNLAWKLAIALRSGGAEALLDSYDAERRRTAEEVLFRTDRAFRKPEGIQAALTDEEEARRMLIQWSQLDLNYRRTPMVEEYASELEDLPLRAGDRAPDGVLVELPGKARRRAFELFRTPGYHLLLFSRGHVQPDTFAELGRRISGSFPGEVHPHFLVETGVEVPPGVTPAYYDPAGALAAVYGAQEDTVVLVRPDGFVGFRSDVLHAERLVPFLERSIGSLVV